MENSAYPSFIHGPRYSLHHKATIFFLALAPYIFSTVQKSLKDEGHTQEIPEMYFNDFIDWADGDVL